MHADLNCRAVAATMAWVLSATNFLTVWVSLTFTTITENGMAWDTSTLWTPEAIMAVDSCLLDTALPRRAIADGLN